MASRQYKNCLPSFFFQTFESAFKEREGKKLKCKAEGWGVGRKAVGGGPESSASGKVLRCSCCFMGAVGYF